MKILLENNVFEEEQEEIIGAIERAGLPYKLCSYSHTVSFDPYSYFERGEKVFFYGSIFLAHQIQRLADWEPGAMANWSNYKLSSAFAHYSQLMFNYEGNFVPMGQVMQEYFGQSLFIRPDDGTKKFAGQMIGGEYDLKYLQSLVSPETMVFVAPFRNIAREFRFVCKGKEIITGCQYRRNNELNTFFGEVTEKSCTFAQKALLYSEWKPDDIFVMDIAEHDDGTMGILEFNALSTSGLYSVNFDKVINAIKELEIYE